MRNTQTYTLSLTGSGSEIGRQLAATAKSSPLLKKLHTETLPGFGKPEADRAERLFTRWCPGLWEELEAFAKELSVPVSQLLYLAMTSLSPRCSQIALLPQKTREGRPLLCRSYEFNDNAESFTLMKTTPEGRYSHLGTSVLFFGREDGMNEHGLAVTMSSCGFPVGPLEYMRKPGVDGLQYWAVVRTLLEQCRTADEVIDCVKEMPIAYNMNLIAMDARAGCVLVETLDGKIAVHRLEEGTGGRSVYAANHPVLPEMIAVENSAMVHSLVRCGAIKDLLEDREKLGREDLKDFLLKPYPDGLCCHFYEEYFGTTKSMIFDPADGTMELCWGGLKENGWTQYRVGGHLKPSCQTITLKDEKSADPVIWTSRPITED